MLAILAAPSAPQHHVWDSSSPPQAIRVDDVPGVVTRKVVAFQCSKVNSGPLDHDASSKRTVAQAIARLLGCDFVDGVDQVPATPGQGSGEAWAEGARYLVPTQTLTTDEAQRWGITRPEHLFGGVVPHPFVATKVISHPLVEPLAPAPPGWSPAHGSRIRDAVLPGYSVFSAEDARAAAGRLLAGGSVRLKDPAGVGGLGQWVIQSLDDLESHLADWSDDQLARHGLVLERNLREVSTLSVGQVMVGDQVAAYVGTQGLTLNHVGHEVYGGSQLEVCRGGFDALLQERLQPNVRRAVEQALQFHQAALDCFPGFFASRCNYDIAQGLDDHGQMLSGVLEQSWRIGGASGAEAVALQAFAGDPSLRRVRASTTEVYADEVVPPPGAWVLYDGPDGHGRRLVKYARVELDVDA
ncbi:DUF3182 family protein [Ideonella sp. DXS29W]|uniref:DUF3182 family protein n=1 Tax=Ideonella lacteola TaxID=2984193 RepID=A0ABU9BI50_9BURK